MTINVDAAAPSAIRAGLKEWAVAVEALKEGRQVLLLRKGGIHEPHGGFRAAHDAFVLVSTREHQKAEQLVPDALDRYAALLGPEAEGGPIVVTACARLEAVHRVPSAAAALRLAGLHVWNEAFVRMRIEYRPEEPLHVLVVRVFVLAAPIRLAHGPALAGCRSWVELPEPAECRGAQPALGDESFARVAAEVERRLTAG